MDKKKEVKDQTNTGKLLEPYKKLILILWFFEVPNTIISKKFLKGRCNTNVLGILKKKWSKDLIKIKDYPKVLELFNTLNIYDLLKEIENNI